MLTLVSLKDVLEKVMTKVEVILFVAGVLFLTGLLLYKLETTNVDIWQPTVESELYMKDKHNVVKLPTSNI